LWKNLEWSRWARRSRTAAPGVRRRGHGMWNPPSDHPLRRFFAGYTEQTFQTTLGIADPALIDYIAVLLSRFVSIDTLYRLHNARGKRLEEVADMLFEVSEMPPEGRTTREVHRHIGDFTLFWTGLYPEALERLRSSLCKDYFVNYCEQGKRSYYIARTFADEPYREEAPVLRRLSFQFEMC